MEIKIRYDNKVIYVVVDVRLGLNNDQAMKLHVCENTSRD